jgi:methylglutamate dehydrogenase subunit B
VLSRIYIEQIVEDNVRIVCPYCGERGNEEFSYVGDASPVRPDPAGANATQRFSEYVYLRDNPRGVFRELWYHAAGCHAWLVVTRDTVTHEITRVEFAGDVTMAQSAAARVGA